MRERPHPGSENGVEIAHALDLRQAMPPALVDAVSCRSRLCALEARDPHVSSPPMFGESRRS
jgi:hypothetical protein